MARIRVEIPEPLQPLAAGAEVLDAGGDTVASALQDLAARQPILVQRVLTRGGELRRHVNLFINDSDVRAGAGLQTTLTDGDVLTVVPSVAGG